MINKWHITPHWSLPGVFFLISQARVLGLELLHYNWCSRQDITKSTLCVNMSGGSPSGTLPSLLGRIPSWLGRIPSRGLPGRILSLPGEIAGESLLGVILGWASGSMMLEVASFVDSFGLPREWGNAPSMFMGLLQIVQKVG